MHHENSHAVRFPAAYNVRSHSALIAATVTVEVCRALHIPSAVAATSSAANVLLLLQMRSCC